MLLFSKIYEFYCLYGIEILLCGATGADFFPIFPNFSHFFPILHIKRSYTVKKIGVSLFIAFYHFLSLFLNSSYKAVIYILLNKVLEKACLQFSLMTIWMQIAHHRLLDRISWIRSINTSISYKQKCGSSSCTKAIQGSLRS